MSATERYDLVQRLGTRHHKEPELALNQNSLFKCCWLGYSNCHHAGHVWTLQSLPWVNPSPVFASVTLCENQIPWQELASASLWCYTYVLATRVDRRRSQFVSCSCGKSNMIPSIQRKLNTIQQNMIIVQHILCSLIKQILELVYMMEIISFLGNMRRQVSQWSYP